MFRSSNGREYLLEEEQRGDDEVRGRSRPRVPAWTAGHQPTVISNCCSVAPVQQVVQKAADIQEAISEGSNSFLFTEYKYMGVFMVCQPGAARRFRSCMCWLWHHSTHHLTHTSVACCLPNKQIIMAVLIFALLGSVTPDESRTRADEVKNGLFSMIAFVLGATTSILCGYLGMKIATYANARTAVEARKGIAPAFMCGECVLCWGVLCCGVAGCG